MSSESHEEKEFGSDKESLNEVAPNDPDSLNSVSDPHTGGNELLRYEERNSPTQMSFPCMQEIRIRGISEDALERVIIRKLDSPTAIVVNEQPLDFSRKSVSSFKEDESARKKMAFEAAVNSRDRKGDCENNPECRDNSFESEKYSRLSEAHEHSRKRKASEAMYHRMGYENSVCYASESRHMFSMDRRLSQVSVNEPNSIQRRVLELNGNNSPSKSPYETDGEKYPHSQHTINAMPDVYTEKSMVQNVRNTVNAAKSRISELTSRYRHSKSPYETEGSTSPHSQPSINEMSHVSNGHFRNGSNIQKERNDRFHIQDILSPDTKYARNEKYADYSRQIHNAVVQPRASPPSDCYPFAKNNPSPKSMNGRYIVDRPGSISPDHSVNLASDSTSSNHSTNHSPESTSQYHSMPLHESNNGSYSLPLHPSAFRYAATDGMHPSIPPPLVPPVFPFTMNPEGYPQGYPGIFANHPPLLSSVYPQPYPPPLLVGEDQPKQKKQRPFKAIDPAALKRGLLPLPILSEIPGCGLIPPPVCNLPVMSNIESNGSAAITNNTECNGSASITNSTECNGSATTANNTECNGSATTNSSPQSLSPDSACIANSSSGNDQDTNGEPGRKKIRRVPPEEKDEKYLEKRRKNNLAAKKSRDERRKKEDELAVAAANYSYHNTLSQQVIQNLSRDIATKTHKLAALGAKLLIFREKCDGRMRAEFEDMFKGFYTPQ